MSVDGNKLFYPTVTSVRGPQEGQVKGNIINPPRYAQLGGMSSSNKPGLRDTVKWFSITKPGASTRRVPFAGGGMSKKGS
jgi:hypothetical protein